MNRWRWALGCGLWMALVGCGSASKEPGSPGGTPPMDEGRPPPAGGTGPADGGMPSSGGDAPSEEEGAPPPDSGVPTSPPRPPSTPSELNGGPSLAAAACVPWTQPVPPQSATACEVLSEFEGSQRPDTRQVARYDAEGQLLERRTFQEDGSPFSLERHSWFRGRETSRLIERYVQDPTSDLTVWTYDPQGRIQQRTERSARKPGTVSQYQYTAQGRLERIDRTSEAGGALQPILYRYSAGGQLESIQTGGTCGQHVSAECEEFTYWSNGKLRNAYRQHGVSKFESEDYDAQGRLTGMLWEQPGLTGEAGRSYDSAGRLVRTWEKVSSASAPHEAVITYSYDVNDLLQVERFAQDILATPEDVSGGTPAVARQRVTRRVTYLCGTPIVWLEEWDANEDGVVDARRTHERDAQGRLTHEEYSGVPGLGGGPIRQDFKYECN
ncbi:type IV secretion protein Rhs [Stigmatella sp. ncwal1]|uniref:Type IV secretion protein Rhs n=1 Tax=Stigmatella ashevillensis TaxID=2995309 RepID=A0ABT5DJX6_9BACT|nr:type IV secretion protein Rhs [Stigmatella ashevillena]MDC0712652.1 type IV secretion protein Rhs [Stigmatella ashevillena]